MEEVVVHAQIHPVFPWTLLGFKSGKFSLCHHTTNHGLEEIFSHAALPELKSVLFCDLHMLSNNTEEEEEATIMVAICAKQICTVDTHSSSSTLIRISPELDSGVSFTGAVVQLDLDHLLLGTSVGSLLCYSLKLRSLVKLAYVAKSVHDGHPITSMVASSSNSIIVSAGGGGDSFLSVWGLAKVPNTTIYSLSHQRKIMFPTGSKWDVVVVDLTFDNEYLMCRFANQTTMVWQIQNSTERLVYKIGSACEMPMCCSAFLYREGSFLTVQQGKLVSAIPQSLAKRIASSLENGIVLSDTSLALKNDDTKETELLIAIRTVAQVAQNKITRFWQHPTLAGWFLVQCEDLTLRIINVHCDVRPKSIADDFNVVGNALMHKSETLCYLHVMYNSSEEFLAQKEALLRCAESPVEGEIVEAFWPGPITLQLSDDGYLMVSWKHHFAVLTNLNRGNTGVKTVLMGEGVALAFVLLSEQQPCLLVVKHIQEPATTLAATTTTETAVSKLFRRGSTPTIIRKRLSLSPAAAAQEMNIKTVLALHHLAAPHPDAYTEIDLGEVDNIDDGIIHCGGNLFVLCNKFSSRFSHLRDGKMVSLYTGPTLPRHQQVAVWQHNQGTTLAFACHGLPDRITIMDVVDRNTVLHRCQVVTTAATVQKEICSMHWHCGTLFFTTADCKVHIAFVGFRADGEDNVMSWVLAQRNVRRTMHNNTPITSKRVLIHASANPNDPRHSPVTLTCPAVGVWLTVRELRGEHVVMQDQHGTEYVAAGLLANKLIKVGMLASAGYGESALKWALMLEDQQLKNLAVDLLQRLGFPKRACCVIDASPRVLLNVMITHECIDQACMVFHPSNGVLQALTAEQDRHDGGLSDCERLALFFATKSRFDCVQWVMDALMANSHNSKATATTFCAGLLRLKNIRD